MSTVTSHAESPNDGSLPQPPPPLAGQDSRTVETNHVAGKLIDVATQFPSVAGTITIDYESQTVVQRYNAQDPSASDFVRAIESVEPGPVTVSVESSNFSEVDLKNAVLELANDPELASSILGSVPQDIGYTDVGLDITLPPSDSSALASNVTEVLGLPASVTVATSAPLPDDAGWQTSGADSSPWSAGAAINAVVGSSGCTSGFVWDKWTTRERFGSTAEHCYPYVPSPTAPTQSWRTPPGSHVGNRYHYNVSADTQLIRLFGPERGVIAGDRRR